MIRELINDPVVDATGADRPAVVVHHVVVIVRREPLLDGRPGDAVGEQALSLPLALQLNQASDLEAPVVDDGGQVRWSKLWAPLRLLGLYKTPHKIADD